MKKRIFTFVLSLVMVLSMTAAPARAAEKPQTKTIEYQAGKQLNDGDADPTTILSITNVTSSEKKDFSVTLTNGGEKQKFTEKKVMCYTVKHQLQ